MYIVRTLEKTIRKYFKASPVIAIIGARQVGKSTLAKKLLSNFKDTILVDLEKASDKQMLTNPESFFELHKKKVICLDEVQLLPNVFSEIRAYVDNNSNVKFIILGSSSPELLRQSAETLAGRIFYFELTPFLFEEIKQKKSLKQYRLLGGMPSSILAKNTETAFIWLENYIKTFLERDLRNFGLNIPPETLRRFWTMLSHYNGQVLNYSQLGNSMGLSHTTIKHYVDILQSTFMIRMIPPYYKNVKKRLIKSPKLYFRDTGILHSLLNIDTFEELYTHPIFGSSWETSVIENILAKYNKWEYFFYRTSNGTEVDLILTKANRTITIEIKASPTPQLSKSYWQALEDINAEENYVIAPVKQIFETKKNVWIMNLESFLNRKI